MLPDVNVLVYACRQDAPDHGHYVRWLESLVNSGEPYAMSDHILSGFLRVVTHPKVFNRPSTFNEAITFASIARTGPCRAYSPGHTPWGNALRALCIGGRDGQSDARCVFRRTRH